MPSFRDVQEDNHAHHPHHSTRLAVLVQAAPVQIVVGGQTLAVRVADMTAAPPEVVDEQATWNSLVGDNRQTTAASWFWTVRAFAFVLALPRPLMTNAFVSPTLSVSADSHNICWCARYLRDPTEGVDGDGR